jgi:hypothetical protein
MPCWTGRQVAVLMGAVGGGSPVVNQFGVWYQGGAGEDLPRVVYRRWMRERAKERERERERDEGGRAQNE